MAGYIGSKASVVSSGAERKKVFNITTSTTALTGLSYTANQVHVFHNGVRLISGTDYTETNDTTITLTTAAENGDQVVVVSYASFQTSDTVSASAGGTFSGAVDVNADGATVLTVDRATSDGTIIDMQKDGSTVGSIGVNGDRIYLTNAQEGIMIDQSANNLSPTSSTGTFNDNAMNLGESGNRWKDLYLSGGLYVGGTGSANKLDDYEEGTWTPTIATTDFTTSGLSVANASYVKVGKIVTLVFSAQFIGTSGYWTIGDYGQLYGIPFSPQNLSCANANSSGSFSGNIRTTFQIIATGTSIFFSPDNVFGSTARSGTVNFHITYEAA